MLYLEMVTASNFRQTIWYENLHTTTLWNKPHLYPFKAVIFHLSTSDNTQADNSKLRTM